MNLQLSRTFFVSLFLFTLCSFSLPNGAFAYSRIGELTMRDLDALANKRWSTLVSSNGQDWIAFIEDEKVEGNFLIGDTKIVYVKVKIPIKNYVSYMDVNLYCSQRSLRIFTVVTYINGHWSSDVRDLSQDYYDADENPEIQMLYNHLCKKYY